MLQNMKKERTREDKQYNEYMKNSYDKRIIEEHKSKRLQKMSEIAEE